VMNRLRPWLSTWEVSWLTRASISSPLLSLMSSCQMMSPCLCKRKPSSSSKTLLKERSSHTNSELRMIVRLSSTSNSNDSKKDNMKQREQSLSRQQSSKKSKK
jgi:hypothetical protein